MAEKVVIKQVEHWIPNDFKVHVNGNIAEESNIARSWLCDKFRKQYKVREIDSLAYLVFKKTVEITGFKFGDDLESVFRQKK